MVLEFDEAKSARNIRDRGISFERFAEIEIGSAGISVDRRMDYGEVRLRILGFIDARLYAAVVTMRGDRVRVISLRKANEREERDYEKERKSS